MPELDARQAKKVELYHAALEAYARFGLQNATARQIAEIAGIGKSTIFEYFKSCEALMDEAFAWYIAQTNAALAGLHSLAEHSAPAALALYFDHLMAMILKEPNKMLLLSQYATAILASSTDFSIVKQAYRDKLQPSADLLMAEFQFMASQGIRAGVFRPVGGAGEEDCALALTAISREMQAQALVQEKEKIKETCLKLKRMAFRILGSEINF